MSNAIEFSRDKDTRDIMSDAKFYEGYSRWNDEKNRYETWEEAVERVMNTHREFYKDKMTNELSALIDEAEELYKNKYFLGAQRALQFGGEQLLKNHMRLYNCTSSYADRAEFFGEFFFILLSGCGAGFSVQKHHIDKLPQIQNRTKQAKIFVVEDSIEGWAEAADVLLSSYFVGGGSKHPDYEGRRVYFDTSNIRAKGAKISGGFKAPGPEPLRRALDKIEHLIQGVVLKGENKLKPIHVYDICMHMADAVLSGGVRRAATICLFSPDDEEMMNAKTGDWYINNKQRARSNNSAVIVRKEASKELFMHIMDSVKQFGEPGFVFVESTEHATNPCVTKDTWVTTKNGPKQISDLLNSGAQELLLNGKWVSTTECGFIKTGVKPTFEVTLDNGMTIKATDDHKFMTDRGWVELKDLQNSDYVLLSNNTDIVLEDTTQFEQGWLIGNLIGDGTFDDNSAKWNYWNGEKSLGHVCENYLKSINLPSKIQRDYDSERNFQIKEEAIVQSVESLRFATIISQEYGIRKGNKVITSSLEKSGIGLMKGVVSGLFDADGSVYGSADKGLVLSITQNNIGNLKAVQRTLARHGIYSRISMDRDEGWNMLPDGKGSEKEYWTKAVYRLYVSGRYYVEKFFNTFTPKNEAKTTKFNSIISQYTKEAYKPKTMQSRVISIISNGIEDVYDCSVPETVSFEANGMWIHNCVEIGMFPQFIDENKISHSGWQGCVSYDTKLITKDGIEYIGDVVSQNREIEIWNGKSWSKVKPIQTGENRKLYRVKFSDGSYLDATENHKFLAKTRFENEYTEYTTMELITLMKTSKYSIQIPRSNIVYDAGGVTEQYAYDYGYILGDGTATLNGSNYRTPFAEIYENEFNVNHYFTDSVTYGNISENEYGSKFKRAYFTGVDKKFAYSLKYNEGLPSEIFGWDRESMKKFIAGWIDSDGTKTTNGFRIYGREDKIRDGQLLLSKMGVDSSVNLMQKAGVETNYSTRKNSVWYLQVSNPKDLISAKIELQENANKITKSKNQLIKHIEELDGLHNSYCFEESELHQGVFNNVLTKQCNLTEINGAKAINKEEFFKAIRGAAIVGTLQAGYTKFKFVSEVTKKIFEREALLGVSITGWMNNPQTLLDDVVLKEGAELVKTINKQVSKLIDINPAARTTCVKPAGNASVLLKTASGIHGEHSPRYIRNVQMNKETEVAKLIKETNPYMVEEGVWSEGKTDYVISFPVISPANSIYRKDLYGINLLEKVKLVQNSWVEYGTDESLCVDPTVRHNVSNTISVLPEQWDEVSEYVFENKKSFAGISFLAASGDRAYNQAPNTEIASEQEIIKKYGRAALFAAGLIVDTFKGFNDLWEACMIAQMPVDSGDKEKSDIRAEWIRRYHKFAESYFDGDLVKTEYCLKDVHLLHRWTKIQQHYVPIDFADQLEEKKYIDIDTTGSAACVGGKDGLGCAI